MRRKSQPPVILLLLILVFILLLLLFRTRQAAKFHSGSPSPGQSSTSAARLGPPDIYPDLLQTPGATDPDIAQANIQDNICNPAWSTRSIRPPLHYTDELKREQIRVYGYDDTNPRDYEEDHLIPLELGGSPTDPRNLWPEPYVASIPDGGAHSKDRVESYLHRQVCSGNLPLQQAQREIATDWYRVYARMAP
jgi:hypothetical protein